MQVTDGQLREMISLRAYAEPSFRSALLSNPKSTIEGLIAFLPSNVKVTVIEETEGHLHLVIPQPTTDELSDDQLSSVAGGILDANDQSAVCVGLAGGGLVTTKLELNL